jgi:hypothetical protein
MKKVPDTNRLVKTSENGMKDNPLEYPLYPDNEDIYNKSVKEKETDMDLDDISKVKKSDINQGTGTGVGEESIDNMSDSGLDIPGAELDDEQENIGSEDEENNYYSLGGDDHNDLDEDKQEVE